MVKLIEEHGLTLLSGSHFHSEPSPQAFVLWERARRPMCSLIPGPGPFLDIGCANGFLLRCLLEWSPFHIVPFGIDVDPTLVKSARELLATSENVQIQDMGIGDPPLWFGRRFRTIYWNVGENLTFNHEQEVGIVVRLQRGLMKSGASLILGFYEQDMDRSYGKVRRLESHGLRVRRTAEGLFALFVEIA
jgi:hypothetical protein